VGWKVSVCAVWFRLALKPACLNGYHMCYLTTLTVAKIIAGRRMNDTDRGKLKYWEKIFCQYQFFEIKSHIE
jgi:hypothetical protein